MGRVGSYTERSIVYALAREADLGLVVYVCYVIGLRLGSVFLCPTIVCGRMTRENKRKDVHTWDTSRAGRARWEHYMYAGFGLI